MLRSFLRVHCEGTERLVPVEQVIEILPLVHIERFDDAEGSIGFIHYRGAMVPVYCAAEPVSLRLSQYLVVVTDGEAQSALLVEDVQDVFDVPEEKCRTAGPQRRLVGVMVPAASDDEDEAAPREVFVRAMAPPRRPA